MKRMSRRERWIMILEGFASGIIFAALTIGWIIFALAW